MNYALVSISKIKRQNIKFPQGMKSDLQKYTNEDPTSQKQEEEMGLVSPFCP